MQPPRSRIVKAVVNASSSWWPRRIGKAPPCLKMNLMIGFVKSCDLAMNRTFRRMKTPAKKWSHWLKWLGARITGPVRRHVLLTDRPEPVASRHGGVRTIRATS